MRFAKLVAAGNCYAAVDGRLGVQDWSEVALLLCRAAPGAETDGLVVVSESRLASFRLQVFNSDGSEAEISGNGLRLAVKFALDRGLVKLEGDALEVETAAGIRKVWPVMERGRMSGGRIRMGAPRFRSADFPSAPDRTLFDLPIEDSTLPITCVSVGNPHAVALLEQPIQDFPLEEVGNLVQNHRLFPNRINFEIVNVIDSATIRARIFERGEGETSSSGTGSTAAAVVSRIHRNLASRIQVECRGGRLQVEWDGEADAYLSGPTEDVAEGRWDPKTGQVTWDA